MSEKATTNTEGDGDDILPFYKKTTFVSDILYGTIALSPIEKQLISTTVFNRLHNVLQNSTVYFTYPSNRTSRYSHSLGVTKLAGEMFRYGLLNADRSVSRGFLKQATEEIKKITISESFSKLLRTYTHHDYNKGLTEKAKKAFIECHFNAAALLARLTEEEAFTYLILYQAVRLTALLHDLGHPPFSHVTEHALNHIFEKSKETKTSNAKTLEELFERFLVAPEERAVFHEALGERLAGRLEDSVLRALLTQSQLLVYPHLLVFEVTAAILGDKPFFKGLHGIVAGELDADRLDYVQRDLMMSGISKEPFRTERLVQSYTLLQGGVEPNCFSFAPSIRALNNVEDFFIQRLHLYKYVIQHHRVVKFDCLLQYCIESLALEYIGKSSSVPVVESQQDPYLLPQDITGLWALFNPETSGYNELRESQYIQWDDAWLLGILRSEYFKLLQDHAKKDENKRILQARLEELLSNRKRYHALYKRAECFLDVDHAFLQAIPMGFKWEFYFLKMFDEKMSAGIPPKGIEKEKTKIIKKCTDLSEFISKARDCNTDDLVALIEGHGYVLSVLREVIKSVQRRKKNPHMPFLHSASRALHLENRTKCSDVILIEKEISPGVESGFILAETNLRSIPLGKVSRVADELRRAVIMASPFFVFLLPEEGGSPAWDEVSLRKRLGQLIWCECEKWITKGSTHANL